MAFTLWSLLETTVLLLNAVCVLHEERFLAKMGWTSANNVQGFGEAPTIKSQILNLMFSIRTVMRIPLIFFNIFFIDIGVNLTDMMYQGLYHGSKKHEPDLKNVLQRSWDGGLDKMIITGTSLEDSKKALEMAKSDDRLYITVGCHPTNSEEFEKIGADQYINGLEELIGECGSKVVALGECGLDYDRLNFASKETQMKYFEKQLILNKKLNLPLFLHCRNAFTDLFGLLDKHKPFRGVVHSFDGTIEQAESFIQLGYLIGINGCSLKTEQNIEVVKEIPEDKILIETDAPWCEVRPTHAGFKYVQTKFESVKKEKWKSDFLVKGRNEPANIIQVLEIISGVKSLPKEELCDQIYKNTLNLFFNS